ncbi:hypothetical protein V1288_002376 [Bradyrhizobium sp. AZCC 2176]
MLPLPCMLVCSFVCANRTRDRGCSKHPVFPAPLFSERANEMQTSGALRREIAKSYSFVARLTRDEDAESHKNNRRQHAGN